MREKPKITVVTVCLNSFNTISKTLNSVLDQSYENIEYIVIDGGSTDGTLDILKAYEAKIDILISEPDDGLYFALNKGIRIASGEYVSILHSDDCFDNCFVIERIMTTFCSDRDCKAVLSDLEMRSSSDVGGVIRKISSGSFSLRKFKFGLMPPHCATVLSKDVYDKFGMFNTKYRIAADFDFFVRVFHKNRIRYSIIPFTSISMRHGGLSTQGLKSYIFISKELQDIVRSHFGIMSSFLVFFRGFWKIQELVWSNGNVCYR